MAGSKSGKRFPKIFNKISHRLGKQCEGSFQISMRIIQKQCKKLAELDNKALRVKTKPEKMKMF